MHYHDVRRHPPLRFSLSYRSANATDPDRNRHVSRASSTVEWTHGFPPNAFWSRRPWPLRKVRDAQPESLDRIVTRFPLSLTPAKALADAPLPQSQPESGSSSPMGDDGIRSRRRKRKGNDEVSSLRFAGHTCDDDLPCSHGGRSPAERW